MAEPRLTRLDRVHEALRCRTLGREVSLDEPIPGSEDVSFGETLPGDAPSPEDVVSRAELVERIGPILTASTTPRGAAVLVLQAYGVPLDEAARALGLPREQARSVARRALSSARRCAANMGVPR